MVGIFLPFSMSLLWVLWFVWIFVSTSFPWTLSIQLFLPSSVTGALTGGNFLMLFGWFYLLSRAPCPPTATDTFLLLRSPRCKAHLRHGGIRVMKYAAHWQRHQSDDSRRTDNRGEVEMQHTKREWGKENKTWRMMKKQAHSHSVLQSHTWKGMWESKKWKINVEGPGKKDKANNLRPDIPSTDSVCLGSPLWQLIKVSC